MSERKWKFYTMAVGEIERIQNPPKTLRTRIYTHAAANGKEFKTKLVNDQLEIRRVK